MSYGATKTHEMARAASSVSARVLPLKPDSAASQFIDDETLSLRNKVMIEDMLQDMRIILPRDLHAALAAAAEGFPAWDVLDAAHMLVASLIVDLVADGDRPGFLRKMDRVLRDRVKEIAARQKPRLVV